MNGATPFHQRRVWWLAGIATVSFIAAIVVAIFGQDIVPRSKAGAHGYSRSALGHHGLVALLRALDIQVLLSEHDSASKAGDDAVLVVAEPLIAAVDGPRAQALRAMHRGFTPTLVVLPKWYGTPDPARPEWLTEVTLLPADEIQPVLQVLGIEATLVRPKQVASWQGSDQMALPAEPVLLNPQLLTDSDADIVPLISSDAGMLLGIFKRADGGWSLVLSDPDIVSNHGLPRGGNAHLAVAIIEFLRRGNPGFYYHTVVFDETLHGFQKEPSMWRALFEFPLALATLQVLLAAIVLLWASMGRFGKPLAPPPAIAPGKGFLVRTTAALLGQGGHAGYALRRYLDAAIREVARALHAPPHLDAAGLKRWLAEIENTRRATHSLAALARQVEDATGESVGPARAVRTAMDIYQWREEMSRGTRDHSWD